MSEIAKIQQYFTRAATAFDSLYSEDGTTSVMKFVNRKFRRDMYERFCLTLEHVRKYALRTILDVGCGPGRYELALAQLEVHKVVAIDVSSRMIQLAKSLTAKLTTSSTQLEFLNEDFMNFQAIETFDVVVAMGFFDYVQNPVEVLQRMGGLARHSVIASFPSISWYRTPIRRARYFFKRCPVHFYRRNEIDSVAKEAGFTRNETLKIEGAGQDYFTVFFK